MPSFQRISCHQAHQLMTDQACNIVDIRDRNSYLAGHASGALALDNNNLGEFINAADKSLPTLVFCYHGNSSQGAAQLLSEQSFADVYSVDGGFESWKLAFPEMIEQGN